MFNLKRKLKNMVQSIKEPQNLIAEIHNEFDTASEFLLEEAKIILAKNDNITDGERLKKLGFYRSKKALEAITFIEDKKEKEELLSLVNYYQTWYPNNKFITEKQVENICKKYGLVCGYVESYIGDIPTKNITEIENFKLRKEDCVKHICRMYKNGHWLCYSEKPIYGYVAHNPGNNGGRYPIFVKTDESQKEAYQQYPFKIVASIKDFDTTNMEIKDGYKIDIKDPIVLQPLINDRHMISGYLIVSKWGLEGKDAELTTEKMN